MGAVYEGENVLIARRVAIKVLYSHVAAQHGVVERFEREAQAAGRIGNDHILEVLDMGAFADGSRFMVMEFLDGETLGERTARLGRLTPQQILPLARQLLVGLVAAHHAGIIHRDLKPDNVFILREKAGQPDFVKIIDFGISKFTALDQDMKMTATGAVMGTPYFMSPEQAKGSRSSDIRSDLYAVGVIIYKALTGVVPFDGATFNELLFKIVLSPVPQPREMLPDLDPAFESIVMKAMARDPEFRFQTAEAFIAGLDAWSRSGAGVTVPPPEASGYNQSQVIGPHTPSGTMLGGNRPATMGTEAKSTWTQAEPQAAPKPSGARWAVPVVLVALAALGAGAFFVLRPAPTAPADDPTIAAGGSSAEPPQNMATLGPPSPRVPEVSPAPTTTDVEATKPQDGSSAADGVGGAANAAGTPAAASSSSTAPTTDKPKAIAGKPHTRPPARPPSPPPAATPPAKPKPKSGGSPDFGY